MLSVLLLLLRSFWLLFTVVAAVVVAIGDLIGDFLLLPPLQVTWVHPSSLLGWSPVSVFVLLLLFFSVIVVVASTAADDAVLVVVEMVVFFPA